MEYMGVFERTKKGFGFIELKDLNEIVFIPANKTIGAMNGDTVKISISNNSKVEGKKIEGEIIDIIDRKTIQIVGVYKDSKHYGFVEVLDKRLSNDFFISKSKKGRLKPLNGQVVVAKISKYPTSNKKGEGIITEILGFKEDEGVDILTIIKRFNINTEFDKNVEKEVLNIPSKVEESNLSNRLDLRNEIVITIDGEDAKDLDDAISLKILPNGNYYLGVHIADVSHYVKEKSYLDKEAYSRGTSVYLVDKVIPMLPKELSNGICSLNPNVDRLTLSCFMEIDKNGKVVNSSIKESVINSKERMTYTDVTKIIKYKDADLINRYSEIYETLLNMSTLQSILYKKRMKRGSIDFEFKESKIEVNEKGFPINICAYERDISNRIIEEFMLICNETIAETMFKKEVPFVYRIHEKPKIEKFETLNKFLLSLNEDCISEEKLHPKILQKIVSKYKGEKEEEIINMLILRSLMKAKYSNLCLEHFGLSANYYCHFTSPIRRYPDLQIHRIIKAIINNEMSAKYRKKLERRVEFASIQSSERELIAQEAENEVHKVKKAEYMKNKIGEVFEGKISSITRFGLYIQLDNTIEGLTTLEMMTDDVYVFNEDKFQVTGLEHKKEFTIGQRVSVEVKDVDMVKKEIYFIIKED